MYKIKRRALYILSHAARKIFCQKQIFYTSFVIIILTL